jgi:hypothetical protein
MNFRKIASSIFLVITSAMVLFSGIMKLTHNTQVVDTLSKYGVAEFINLFGAMEIVFTVLFIFPKTMKIGFILLSCYFSGAMATELSHEHGILNPLLPIALVWVTAFLRDSSIFLPGKKR